VDRRVFVAGTLGLIAAPLVAQAQPAGKVYRIGWLHTGWPPDFGPPNPRTNLGAFRQSLFELGYVEGRTFVIEGRFADAKVDRLPAVLRQYSVRSPSFGPKVVLRQPRSERGPSGLAIDERRVRRRDWIGRWWRRLRRLNYAAWRR
jgi:hypothetical protein